MGPKSKKPEPKPESTVNEVVTELDKATFDIQLQDIDKRINRLNERQEELKLKKEEIEEKIEEYKKETGFEIAEKEQELLAKEEEKIMKREETIRLTKEIKIRAEAHKKKIQELDEKYDKMVEDMKKAVEELTEQSRILEDFKTNKEYYSGLLVNLQKKLIEMEMEHQRNLFAIQQKGEMAQVRLKKDLQFKLLNLSIEFQQKHQKQIGDSCHRITLENKAIEAELSHMGEELEEYRQMKVKALQSLHENRIQERDNMLEKDKAIARIMIQNSIITRLKSEKNNILQELKIYSGVDAENASLVRKLKATEHEIEYKLSQIENLNNLIEQKLEETSRLKEASSQIRKNSRKVLVIMRNALKITEEALAVKLIPAGKMEEEKYLPTEAKIRLFKKRRGSAFVKKGRILQYLFETLSKAQITEDDLKLVQLTQGATETLEELDFTQIFGKPGADKDEGLESTVDESKAESVVLVICSSEFSLPRSVSELAVEEKVKAESMEGEIEGEVENVEAEKDEEDLEVAMGEYDEYEEEDEDEEQEDEQNNDEGSGQ